MEIGECCTQGDVLCLRIEGIPEGLRPVERDNGKIVLAYGEVTGHSHAIEAAGATLLESPTNTEVMTLSPMIERYLQVVEDGGVELRHEEHDVHVLEPGCYKIITQREFVPKAAPRPVYD